MSDCLECGAPLTDNLFYCGHCPGCKGACRIENSDDQCDSKFILAVGAYVCTLPDGHKGKYHIACAELEDGTLMHDLFKWEIDYYGKV